MKALIDALAEGDKIALIRMGEDDVFMKKLRKKLGKLFGSKITTHQELEVMMLKMVSLAYEPVNQKYPMHHGEYMFVPTKKSITLKEYKKMGKFYKTLFPEQYQQLQNVKTKDKARDLLKHMIEQKEKLKVELFRKELTTLFKRKESLSKRK